MKKILSAVNTFFLIISIIPLFIYDFDYPNWFYLILFIFSIIGILFLYYNKMYDNKIIFLIDLIGAFSLLSRFRVIILLRLIRLISVFRRLGASKTLVHLFKYNSKILLFIFEIIIIYVVIISVIMFNIEPETFNYSFFEAFYWGVITLTSIGYGDVVPVTTMGQVITIISSLLGIGIIALPTGLFASGFIQCYNELKDKGDFNG